MAFKISKEKKFIIKTRIEIGTELGAENPGDAFVILQEPDGLEFMEFQTGVQALEDKNQQTLYSTKKIIENLPAVIQEHNLVDDEGKDLSPEEVVGLIRSKTGLMTKVLDQYAREVLYFLLRRSGKKGSSK